jgi:hypothetical protein
MTGFNAVEKVYAGLKGLGLPLKGGIYQYTKPVNIEDEEFIVINSLVVPEAILQVAHVNVNLFVRDIEPGTPDNDRLQTLTDEILHTFPFAVSGEDIQVFKDSTSLFEDGDYNRHYVNIRFKVIMLNN